MLYYERMTLEHKIEAVLFYKAKPIAISYLAKFFEVTEEEIGNSLFDLQQSLAHRGIRLLVSDNREVQMVTAGELAEVIETLRKDEMKQDIGTAGAETLAIVLYRGPINRAEIDRIRGVNSSFILRNLQIRGLVERQGSGSGSGFQYVGTPALLAHLGITQKEALPDYSKVVTALEEFMAAEAQQNVTQEVAVSTDDES